MLNKIISSLLNERCKKKKLPVKRPTTVSQTKNKEMPTIDCCVCCRFSKGKLFYYRYKLISDNIGNLLWLTAKYSVETLNYPQRKITQNKHRAAFVFNNLKRKHLKKFLKNYKI